MKICLNERKIVGNMKNNGNDNKKHTNRQTDSGNGNGKIYKLMCEDLLS
jgi:hypothetical protein